MHRLYLLSREEVIDIDHLTGHLDSEQSSSKQTLIGSELSPTDRLVNDQDLQQFNNEILTSKGKIEGSLSGRYDFSRDKKIAIDHFENVYVSKLLEISGGNITRAATLCGKERRAFGRLVKKVSRSNAYSS